jgi:hypothetical protein
VRRCGGCKVVVSDGESGVSGGEGTGAVGL